MYNFRAKANILYKYVLSEMNIQEKLKFFIGKCYKTRKEFAAYSGASSPPLPFESPHLCRLKVPGYSGQSPR